MANYLPVLGEFTMLSQANINMLDLAYTMPNLQKKKTSLEVVFIKLYEKFIQTGKLSALEEKRRLKIIWQSIVLNSLC